MSKRRAAEITLLPQEDCDPHAVVSSYTPVSGDLRVLADWTIQIRRYLPRAEDSAWHDISLRRFVLPPTSLYPNVTRLIDRPELCRLVAAAVDALLLRTSPSNSRHERMCGLVGDLCKLFEYCWLHRMYALRDVPDSQWRILTDQLGEGGWLLALDLETRTRALAATLSVEQVSRLLQDARGEKQVSREHGTISLETYRLLGTNAILTATPVVRTVFGAIRDFRNSSPPPAPQKPTQTVLARIYGNLNLLADLVDEGALRNLPVPGAKRMAAAYGRPGARTPSLSPDLLADRLTQAYEWIYVIGPDVEKIYRSLMKRIISKDGTHPCPETVTYHLRRLTATAIFEQRHGYMVTTLTLREGAANATSLRLLLEKTLTACFIVISTMNARRKQEVIHKSLGMHSNSLVEVDPRIGLYECEFYIEKTVRDFVPFFINQVTRDAVQLLGRLASLTWAWAKAGAVVPHPPRDHREEKLFVLPEFGGRRVTGELRMTWYRYRMDAIFGLESPGLSTVHSPQLDFATHIGRRAYCLLYMYGYDHPVILALRQKLCGTLQSAIHYVTDSTATTLLESGYARWAASCKQTLKAYDLIRDEIGAEMEAVAREKLHEFVEDVVGRKRRFSGGYWRLVDRSQAMLSRHIDYRLLSRSGQINKLAETLLERGQLPMPFIHGNCNAGTSKRLGRCRSQKEGRLLKENASPIVCADCPYHDCTTVHVTSLELEADRMRAELASSGHTVRGANLRTDLVGLERVIVLHKARLGIDG